MKNLTCICPSGLIVWSAVTASIKIIPWGFFLLCGFCCCFSRETWVIYWSPGMPFPFGKTSAAMCIYCGPLAGNAKSEFSSQPVVEKSIHSFSPNICFLGDVLNSFCPFLGALVKKVERSDVTCDSTWNVSLAENSQTLKLKDKCGRSPNRLQNVRQTGRGHSLRQSSYCNSCAHLWIDKSVIEAFFCIYTCLKAAYHR